MTRSLPEKTFEHWCSIQQIRQLTDENIVDLLEGS